MKSILIILALSLSYFTIAQQSGVRIEKASNPGEAINGETIYVNSSVPTVYAYLKVVNLADSSNSYYWQRSFCEGNPGLVGEQFCDNWSCVDLPQNNDDWTVAESREILSGASTVFEPKVVFEGSQCDSILICYYILNTAFERIDSIKIQFNYLNPNICPQLVNVEPISLSDSKVYPNPSTGIITVKDAPAGSDIEITDMVGKVVFKAKLNGTTQNFDLSKNPDGIYFYTIRAADGQSVITKRIVLRK